MALRDELHLPAGMTMTLASTTADYADQQVTLAQLRTICPSAPGDDLVELNAALVEFGITSARARAGFLAQVGFESDSFRAFTERWGPTEDQKRYEPPSVLSGHLGNIEPGDGLRYRGRGGIQLTGRFNYRRAGQALGVDLEAHPELAATPALRYRVSGWYWREHGLTPYAEDGDVDALTLRINGKGMYGRTERRVLYERALQALGASGVCGG